MDKIPEEYECDNQLSFDRECGNCKRLFDCNGKPDGIDCNLYEERYGEKEKLD